jgi:hypothetical protein
MDDLFEVIGLFTLPLSIGLGIAWWLTRGELRRLHAERGPGAAPADRLEQLEQVVESIALEVERLSEAQRFTTRLLAERAASERLGARSPALSTAPQLRASADPSAAGRVNGSDVD